MKCRPLHSIPVPSFACFPTSPTLYYHILSSQRQQAGSDLDGICLPFPVTGFSGTWCSPFELSLTREIKLLFFFFFSFSLSFLQRFPSELVQHWGVDASILSHQVRLLLLFLQHMPRVLDTGWPIYTVLIVSLGQLSRLLKGAGEPLETTWPRDR